MNRKIDGIDGSELSFNKLFACIYVQLFATCKETVI